MSQDNHITLRGFVTAEPRFFQVTEAKIAMTEVRVGSTPRRLNRATGEWEDLETSYYTVKCWRRLAMNAKASLHKGDLVVIRGKFYQTSWVDKETQRPRTAVEIEADTIGHDLVYGHAIFNRAGQSRAGSAAAVNAGELARQDLGPDGDETGGDDGYGGADAMAAAADREWTDDEPVPTDRLAADPDAAMVTSEYGAADPLAVPF